jgi:alkylhydroperoxidase family enzyme
MGHTEMILAVAGLDELELKDRVSQLASGDWSSFKPAERAGLLLACKLTRTPWQIQKQDIDTLTAHLGQERALETIYYICGCNHMTRVADAFQLPVEPDNVFMAFKNPAQKAAAHVPVLTDAEAWRNLPPVKEGFGQHLPNWIRALAGSLPKTAAAMIDLDYVQRAESPLAPKLRAELRWMVAHANRCEYAKAYARADYVRAGGSPLDIDDLPRRLEGLPEAERLALQVVRLLTEAAYSLSDAQVARLVELYGEKNVMAIVLVAAYGNFQDRLLLGLGVQVEPDGPFPPVRVRFHKPPPPETPEPKKDAPTQKAQAKPKRKLSPPAQNPPILPEKVDDPEWTALPFEALRDRLKSQIARRQARISVPDSDTVRNNLPNGIPRPTKPIRIAWSRVTMGHQPRLSAAWSAGLRAFREESDLNPEFHESMFWVVTRSLQCFY